MESDPNINGIVIPKSIMSDSIIELAKALSKAQGAMSAAAKDGTNPFYNNAKYASLASIWDSIRKPLADNGLAITQLTGGKNTGVEITTLLLHSSGEWVKSCMVLTPVKADPQGMGSAITYGRRYALSAIVGAVADEDDDGNGASAPKDHQPRPAPSAPKAAAKPVATPPKMPEGVNKSTLSESQQETFDKIAGVLIEKCAKKGEKWAPMMEDVLEMLSEVRSNGELQMGGVREIGKLNFVRKQGKNMSQAEFVLKHLTQTPAEELERILADWRLSK